MEIDDTEDVDDVEANQPDEDLYPPSPQEDLEVTKRMERRRVLTFVHALKNFLSFRMKYNLQGYQLYYQLSPR